MDTIDILIKFPRSLAIQIEEHCLNHGMDFTKYFLALHEKSQESPKACSEKLVQKELINEQNDTETYPKGYKVCVPEEKSKKKIKR